MLMLMPVPTAHSDARQPVALEARPRLAQRKVASACPTLTPRTDGALSLPGAVAGA